MISQEINLKGKDLVKKLIYQMLQESLLKKDNKKGRG